MHFGNRWYNPTLGRWTQQDTLDAPLDPTNANRYAYAGCDPINNSDPTGRSCTRAFLAYTGLTLTAIGAAIGGIVTSPTGLGAVGFGFVLAGAVTGVAASRVAVYEECGV